MATRLTILLRDELTCACWTDSIERGAPADCTKCPLRLSDDKLQSIARALLEEARYGDLVGIAKTVKLLLPGFCKGCQEYSDSWPEYCDRCEWMRFRARLDAILDTIGENHD